MKIFQKVLAVICSFAVSGTMGFPCSSTNLWAYADETQETINSLYDGGSGTEEDPYLIATAEQLNNVRNNLDAYFRQTADIDLSLFPEWIPIGTSLSQAFIDYFKLENAETEAFSGSYDGNGFSISNLSISSPYYEYAGLFGLSYGQLSNITLTNVNINIDRDIIDFVDMYNNHIGVFMYVGGVAGYSVAKYNYESHPITKSCKVDGYISVKNTNDIYLGGILGSGQVIDCINQAEITVLSNKDGRYKKDARAMVGGILGESTTINGTVKRCINYGKINVISGTYAKVGGISGEHGQIKYCVNYGNIYGEVIGHSGYSGFADNVNVGGIVGATSSDENDHLVNYGNVSAFASCNESWSLSGCAGGIAGFNGYYSSGYIEKSYNLCDEVKAEPYNFIAGRICGGEGGYEKLFNENYSIDTTLTNGVIPTEYVASDARNGESIPQKELEPLVNKILYMIELGVDESFGELTVTGISDVDNVLFYDDPTFEIKLEENKQLNSGDILLRKCDDDSVVAIIPCYDNFYDDNGAIDLYEYCWEQTVDGSIYFNFNEVFFFNNVVHNKAYYFDLQTITVDNVHPFTQQDSKEKFSFKTGFSVFPLKQTFNFTNINDFFWSASEGDYYHITSAFYNNEIAPLNKNIRNKVFSYIIKEKWNGSCSGMSAVMMLQNSEAIYGAFNKFQNHYKYTCHYDAPVKTSGIPYGSRDLINYFQVFNGIINNHKEESNIETIEYILNKASKISKTNDIFQLLYSFYIEGNTVAAHAVNVLGRIDDSNRMYVYDSNYNNIVIYEIKFEGKRIFFEISSLDGNKSKLLEINSKPNSIGYRTISDYIGYIPDSLINRTVVQVSQDLPLILHNSLKQSLSLFKDGSHEGDLTPDDFFYLASGENLADIIISLPGDDHYEILPIDGKLDYDILNENMYYAVKAESAKNSVVDAKEGVQLVENIGEFSLTVTSDNDTYDMFAVAGNGQGDISCTYTDSGVLVDSDINGLTVTIYDGFDTNEFVLSDAVDKFIVTESEDKPAILVDTDNDGNFETNIIKQTITIPDNVTVITALEKIINNGDEVNEGDVLHIEVIAPEGKRLTYLTVNGVAIENGATYTVGTENVVIAVTFEDITELPAEKIKITIPKNVAVTRDGVAVNNGDEIHSGDILRIEATVPDNKKLTSLTANGVAIENGATYTVGTENVVIAVTFEDITELPAEKIKITIPKNVAVTRDGVAVNNGDEVNSDDVLHIEATSPVGKKLASLTVNGVAIENGSTYTVGDEDVIIAVTFEDIETPPVDKYTITIPSGITVTRQNITLNNGDEISEGDVLNINVDIPSGYRLSFLTVNGKSIGNGYIYTVEKENVVIDASFEKLSDDIPILPDLPNRPDDDSKPDNTKQPFIISNSDIIGWGNILDELTVSPDKTVMVDMNGTTVLPANILQAIKDNNINFMLKMDDQVSWSIDGKDIEKIDRDIDLQVIIGADNIPEDSIKKFVGEREYLTLSIKHSGDLGLNAFLVIDVREQYSNEPAALYWFSDNTFKLEDSCKVQYGKAVLKFTHASDWIIAFGEAEPPTDSDNSNSDSSTDDTSRPIDARPNETKPDESNNSKPTTTEPSNSSDDEKDNPHTGGSRVSLTTFLALIASAALCLITRKQKR